jgi:hypothetical protein
MSLHNTKKRCSTIYLWNKEKCRWVKKFITLLTGYNILILKKHWIIQRKGNTRTEEACSDGVLTFASELGRGWWGAAPVPEHLSSKSWPVLYFWRRVQGRTFGRLLAATRERGASSSTMAGQTPSADAPVAMIKWTKGTSRRGALLRMCLLMRRYGGTEDS